MRYWTVEEARRFLPRLKHLLETIREARQVEAGRVGSRNGSSSPEADAKQAAHEIEDLSIILRDATTGLTDFPALGEDGVVYYLCWRLGEDDLSWWHLPEEGFPGRKPLPRYPRGPGGSL
ncbi:MAG TPA: DUF2203 domain-containing protein [Acidimicrobiales bacterium]